MGLSSSREAMPENTRGIFQTARDAVADARVRGLFSNKKYREARDLANELLLRREILGKSHPSWQQCAETLLEIYYVSGEYERAVRLMEDAMRFTDENSQLYFTRLSKLAGLHEKMGAYESAEPLYLQALQLRKSTLGDEHPDVMSSLSYLAALYRKLGAYQKAEKHLNDAKSILDKSQSWHRKREPVYENWLVSMAMLQHAMGRYESAEPLLSEALLLQEPRQSLGERPERFYATTLSLHAGTCAALGMHQQAEEHFVKALDMRRALFGTNHPHVAASLHEFGVYRMACDKFSAAEEAFKESARIRETTLGEDHPLLAESLSALAECYCFKSFQTGFEQGYHEALKLLKKVGQIRLKTISKVLRSVSESRRFAYLQTIESTLHLLVSLVVGPLHKDENARIAAFDAVLKWKGITFDAQLAEEKDPELAMLRNKLARLILDASSREQVEDCEMEIERLEASVTRSMDLRERLEQATVESVTDVLPAGCQLLEFLLYRQTDFAKSTQASRALCYAAMLVGPAVGAKVWHCGVAQTIDDKISQFRRLVQTPALPNSIGRRKDFDAVGSELVHLLLGPLQDQSLEHLFIAADGELSCLPFAALPGSSGGFLADALWTVSSWPEHHRRVLKLSLSFSSLPNRRLAIIDMI